MFRIGVWLLTEFSQNVQCQGWLSKWQLEPMLVRLRNLVPDLEQGEWRAFVYGYLLLSIVVLNSMAQYVVGLLPGHLVILNNATAHQAGQQLLIWLSMGLMTCLQGMKTVLCWVATIACEVILALSVLILLLLQKSPRPVSTAVS